MLTFKNKYRSEPLPHDLYVELQDIRTKLATLDQRIVELTRELQDTKDRYHHGHAIQRHWKPE